MYEFDFISAGASGNPFMGHLSAIISHFYPSVGLSSRVVVKIRTLPLWLVGLILLSGDLGCRSTAYLSIAVVRRRCTKLNHFIILVEP